MSFAMQTELRPTLTARKTPNFRRFHAVCNATDVYCNAPKCCNVACGAVLGDTVCLLLFAHAHNCVLCLRATALS